MYYVKPIKLAFRISNVAVIRAFLLNLTAEMCFLKPIITKLHNKRSLRSSLTKQERNCRGADGSIEGKIGFHGIRGEFEAQASYIAQGLIPSLTARGFQPDLIGVLYRAA